MRFTILLYVGYLYLLSSCGLGSHLEAAEAPLASVDLTTRAGLAAVGAQWRYSDVAIAPTQHRAPDASGQPTGAPVDTWDIEPHAGARDFDDSQWAVVDPTSLAARRGHGRVSFNWYRTTITVPGQIDAVSTSGRLLTFETSLDDYAEIWVDGELPRATGQSGGSVVAGWNANNHVILTRSARPGQKISIAVFGINGPISDPPTNFIWMRLARLEVHPGSPDPVAVPPQEVNVSVERRDAAIDALVPANPKIFKLAEGFQFSEGPVWVRDGGYLLFSDPNANRIYAYQEESAALSLYRPKSGYDGADIGEYTQPGSNGLALDPTGHLTINQHGNRRVVRVEDDGSLTVLADRYDGHRLNSPNDLTYRSDGSVYFTDPPFGLPKFFDDPRRELDFSGVYRTDGHHVALLTKDFKGPNGLAFSPDEQYLYVSNWDPQAKTVRRYPVERDGSLGAGTVFADMTQEVPGEEALDGLKVDAQGNVWVAAPDGLRIYSAAGRHLGTIHAPRPIHNFTWGGRDGMTLYMTARDRLYRMPLNVKGARS
jgi:gluconolactonase